jgi:HlyD family secretion protein
LTHPLFRQQALDHIADPDQLDASLQIVRPYAVYGLLFAAAVVAGGVLWSMLATAPEKVSGTGLLLSPAGVSAATAPDHGIVDQLLVALGDYVERDQPVVTISRPDLADQLDSSRAELALAQAELSRLEEATGRRRELAEQRHQQLIDSYEQRLVNLAEQVDSLSTLAVGMRELRQQGLVSAERMLDTEIRLTTTQQDLTSVEALITERTLELQTQLNLQEAELEAKSSEVQRLSRRVEVLSNEMARKRLATTPVAGWVVEATVSPGDPVITGQTLLRLLPGTVHQVPGPLDVALIEVVSFIPASEGRRVEPGMTAQVDLSTVRRELDGYLLGRVHRVSDLSASRASLMNRLRDDVLVDQLLRDGAAVEVVIHLQPDPDSHSGYAWSSGRGPLVTLQPGTLTHTEVVVDRRPILSLMFPAYDHFLGWLRIARHTLFGQRRASSDSMAEPSTSS